MASRSTRSPRGRAVEVNFDDEGGGAAAFLVRHRRLVGGVTAFAVAFSYVAANAVWYQPHAHGSAFFATRPLGGQQGATDAGEPAARQETIIRLEREAAPAAGLPAAPAQQVAPPPEPSRQAALPAPPQQAAAPKGDPTVEKVQRILSELNLYAGEVDGLTGPQTRAAIERYRRVVGLEPSSEIDDRLLAQLGAKPRQELAETPAAAPVPTQQPVAGTDMIQTASAPPKGDPTIMRIQAGLKAFGNEGIEIDGMVGPRTRSALREFQSLFGLPETGEPDAAVYAKMREIGLTD